MNKPKNKAAREWAQALIQAAAEGKHIEVWDARDKNKAAQDLGSLGGKAGKGAAKRRSKAHFLAELVVAADFSAPARM